MLFKSFSKNLCNTLNALIQWPLTKSRSHQQWCQFVRDYKKFRLLSQDKSVRFAMRWGDRLPCLNDKTSNTGFDSHYIYHLAWAVRVLVQTKPDVHIDISSSLHFCSLVSAFLPVKFYDYRPAELSLSNLSVEAADLTALSFLSRSIPSLSCMHVVEHIGLGRYGDALDPDGDLKAMGELQRVLAVGGVLLFVVPVGRPRIVFNAHRIYSYQLIISAFPELKLKEFALIPDNPAEGGLVYRAKKEMADAQVYGCGCFWFTRES